MNAVMLQTYWCTDEYIVEYEQNGSDGLWGTETAGRTPAPFVRFIRDRVCETQKELLRLMGQSIALDDEGVKRANYEGVNEGVNQDWGLAPVGSAILAVILTHSIIYRREKRRLSPVGFFKSESAELPREQQV